MNQLALVLLLVGSLTASEHVPVPVRASVSASAPDDAVASLRTDIARILRQSRLGERAGVLVVSIGRGDTLFAHNAGSTLVPASNQKLFTTLAALHYLGPEFRYRTYLMATGPVVDGVLEGDVVLYGTGDPTLSDRFGERVLGLLADSLAALGVREVRGAIVGDASYFGGPGIGAGWQAGYSNALYAAPSSALSLSENIATLVIAPSGTAGGRPVMRIAPGGDGLEVVNAATTIASGRTRVNLGRSGYDGPLTVRGVVSSRTGTVRYPVPVTDPALFAAAALREEIEERGIRVNGATHSVREANASPLSSRSLFAPAPGSNTAWMVAVHTSPRLLDVLEVVNKRSNNFMAEQVLRTIGRVVAGDGTIEGGTRAVARFASEVVGVDSASFEPFDGSGLSPLNRASPAAFVELLRFSARMPAWDAFWSTLPETGARDGLRRMLGTVAQGRVRAKTGTIRQVSALTGFVRTTDGEWLAFSILNNAASSASRAKRAEDAIVTRLASFSRSRDAIGPAPEPIAPASALRSPGDVTAR